MLFSNLHNTETFSFRMTIFITSIFYLFTKAHPTICLFPLKS